MEGVRVVLITRHLDRGDSWEHGETVVYFVAVEAEVLSTLVDPCITVLIFFVFVVVIFIFCMENIWHYPQNGDVGNPVVHILGEVTEFFIVDLVAQASKR